MKSLWGYKTEIYGAAGVVGCSLTSAGILRGRSDEPTASVRKDATAHVPQAEGPAWVGGGGGLWKDGSTCLSRVLSLKIFQMIIVSFIYHFSFLYRV